MIDHSYSIEKKGIKLRENIVVYAPQKEIPLR